jgi:hypothetical protein
MKNIERPEVQTYLIKFLTQTGYGETCFKEALFMYGMPYDKHKRKAWLMSEYVEPHKWEPWELEALKHIDKKYTSIEYVEGYVCVTEFGRDEKNLSIINFPSIKEGDLIYIDEELERNGIHR